MIYRIRLWLWERRMRSLIAWHVDTSKGAPGAGEILWIIDREIEQHNMRRPKR